jgi:predicted transcriptional regulator
MHRESYHPNAYLSQIKNIRRGLRARTKILTFLEKGSSDTNAISKGTGMSYGVITHHLKLLKAEEIVERKEKKPHVWTLTGLGQKRLVNVD